MPKWLIPVLGGAGLLTTVGALVAASRVKPEWFPAPVLGGGKGRTAASWSQSLPRPGRVLLIGDSIGAHGGFVRALDAALPGHTFQNEAVVGDSTARMLLVAERTIRPNVYSEIIIEGNLNDGDRSSDWTKSNLRRIYQMARDSGARVVAIGATPWRGYVRWSQEAQDREDEVERWLEAGADGLIDAYARVYDAVEDPARPGYVNPEFEARDHLHLNSAGQRAMGTAILEQAYSDS